MFSYVYNFVGFVKVSRTFGDCTAKMEKYGGNPNCIIADPDIFVVPNTGELDFVLIGSDGIFDRISTDETCEIVIDEIRAYTEGIRGSSKIRQGSFEHISNSCGQAVDRLMLSAMEKESMDNLSVVILSFANLTKYLENVEP